MKRIMNQPGTEYDGEFMTMAEGSAAIMALAAVNGWTGERLALELESWKNRF